MTDGKVNADSLLQDVLTLADRADDMLDDEDKVGNYTAFAEMLSDLHASIVELHEWISNTHEIPRVWQDSATEELPPF